MALLFPDNTVLINFAYCGEMALLETIVGAKGAWVASVEAECNQKADELQLPELRTARQIFGKPLRPETPAEHIQVRIHRDHFSSPGDGPKKHLGESETLAILECRDLGTTIFVTDDRQVSLRATACMIPVTCITTWDLVRFAVRADHADEAIALRMRRTLMTHDRVHIGYVRDEMAFVNGLNES